MSNRQIKQSTQLGDNGSNSFISFHLSKVNKTITDIQQSKDSDKIRKLHHEINWIKDNLTDKSSILHGIYLTNKRDIILHWASCLEQLHTLGEYEKPLDSISNHIRKKLISIGLDGAVPYAYDVLPSKYKHHKPNPDFRFINYAGIEEKSKVLGDSKKNSSSSVYRTSQDSIILESLESFKEYHLWWKKIADVYTLHLKDPNIHKDFENVIEWQELAKLCSSLKNLYGPMSLLQQILDEGSIKQSATMFQKAMCVMFGADTSFRQWAYKFGVSPRQHQRIRERLADWPKKNAEKIIQNIIGSYCCPKCGYNLIERKFNNIKKQTKNQNNTHRNLSIFRDFEYKIPKSLKENGLNPLEIAELLWKDKLLPIPGEP